MNLWYHAQLILEWEILQRDGVDKIKNTACIKYPFFERKKKSLLWDKVEKYGRARQATDYNITLSMRIAGWNIKPTEALSE
jgi:hypothetical protein